MSYRYRFVIEVPGTSNIEEVIEFDADPTAEELEDALTTLYENHLPGHYYPVND